MMKTFIQSKYRVLRFWVMLISVFALISFTGYLAIKSLPVETSDLFSGSGNCIQCHSAAQGVLQTSDGSDVSPVKGWKSTMMAHASKDPYWQAKVSAEVDAHPELQSLIEDKCNTCHAPMGRTEAVYDGEERFSFSSAVNDPLSMDGVSCAVCHQISGEGLGGYESFSGGYTIQDSRIIYGPYKDPFKNPMIANVNYTPEYGEHIKESVLCATCHTLFTPFLDDEMNIGGYFPEQTPFLEWLNSDYRENEKSCQSCHMPVIEESMKISSLPPLLKNLRNPVWEHEFAGGNHFMNKLLKSNIEDLSLNASEAEMDSTADRTIKMLKKAVEVFEFDYIENDSLVIELKLTNQTGHKFPTGFPSRKAWIHLQIYDKLGKLVFESGEYDITGKILDENSIYEKHHPEITNENHVQIYQAVMGDVNDELTYTLLRGSKYLKDNRLLPLGYKAGMFADSVTTIIGKALEDTDFNFSDMGEEGSGADKVRYKIPVSLLGGSYTFKAELCYQSVSPEFIIDLENHQTTAVEKFIELYKKEDNRPLIINALEGGGEIIHIENNFLEESIKIYPNPAHDRILIEMMLDKRSELDFLLADISGKQLRNMNKTGLDSGYHNFEIILTDIEKQNDQLLLIILYEGRLISRKIILR